MSSVNPINGGVAPLPTAGHDHRGPDAAERRNETALEQPSSPAPVPVSQELAAGAEELQRRLDRMPGGGEREARLLYEQRDGTFIVEIRDKETGELVQSYPAENSLNRTPSAADLLGTVIDRRS
jgi:uncharacterized FlaG/YvyC family protein